MSFEINSPTGSPEDQYIYEVTGKDNDTNRLSVARVLSGSKKRAKALVRCANSTEYLIKKIGKIVRGEHSDAHEAQEIAENAINSFLE